MATILAEQEGDDGRTVRVEDDHGAQRYVVYVDGERAGFATYADAPGVRTVIHTEVDPRFEHHGVAGALARAALDDLKARAVRLVPRCPFFARFVASHPEYADLVT